MRFSFPAGAGGGALLLAALPALATAKDGIVAFRHPPKSEQEERRLNEEQIQKLLESPKCEAFYALVYDTVDEILDKYTDKDIAEFMCSEEGSDRELEEEAASDDPCWAAMEAVMVKVAEESESSTTELDGDGGGATGCQEEYEQSLASLRSFMADDDGSGRLLRGSGRLLGGWGSFGKLLGKVGGKVVGAIGTVVKAAGRLGGKKVVKLFKKAGKTVKKGKEKIKKAAKKLVKKKKNFKKCNPLKKIGKKLAGATVDLAAEEFLKKESGEESSEVDSVLEPLKDNLSLPLKGGKCSKKKPHHKKKKRMVDKLEFDMDDHMLDDLDTTSWNDVTEDTGSFVEEEFDSWRDDPNEDSP